MPEGPSKRFVFNRQLRHRLMFLVLVTSSVVFISLGETSFNFIKGYLADLHPESAKAGIVESFNEEIHLLRWYFIFATATAIAALVLVVHFVSGLIVKPVKSLTAGVKEISKGNYGYRIPVVTPDEIGYLTEQFNEMAEGLQEREFIRDTFGRYVAKEVAVDVLSGNVELGGEEREVSVLFADVRNFSSFAENASAAQVVSFLNRYFSRMDECIQRHGGWINRYMGDGLMAVFGAPRTLLNSAECAVGAAYDMLASVHEMDRKFSQEHQIGIGIDTGRVIVGNIGSENRAEYTCIGDTVNIAARMEGLTKEYQIPLLITRETAQALCVQSFRPVLIDKVRLIGRSAPIECFSVFGEGRNEGFQVQCQKYNEAMELYFLGQFEEALQALTECTLDLRFVSLMRNRIERLASDPPESWSGVYHQQQK